MRLDFYNCPKPEPLDAGRLPADPSFLSYKPDFGLISKYAQGYEKYPKLLILAHGGSLTTFYGYYHALRYQAKKEVYFLNTVDPDYIFELKQILKPEETLVLSISKSGENTTQLEMTMQFIGYPLVVVTEAHTPLGVIAEKLKLPVILHPPIGGRYTGLTEVALLPAGIAGLDVKNIFLGAREIYQEYRKDNLAWKAASVFWQLEQQGIVDVFMPFYSHNLYFMSNLIVQLCHESFGKQALGQTYFAHEAPESQHHTNQRFFGGRKNIAGFFISSDSVLHPTLNVYPPAVHGVAIKNRAIFDLNKIPLEKSLEYELLGTLEDARIKGIPVAHFAISGYIPAQLGMFVAFWQLYAVYASVLRGVNPFDQPQVENSKNLSFTKRLASKGLAV